MSSVGLFNTSAQADEATKLVSNRVSEEKLDELLPEGAEDHGRRDRRPKDARARPGQTGVRNPRERPHSRAVRRFGPS
jgi:hypothetical protein